MSRSWPKYGDNDRKYREVKDKERTADIMEPALHIAQQANTAICPKCGSEDIVEYIKPPVLFVCNACHASWANSSSWPGRCAKLQEC